MRMYKVFMKYTKIDNKHKLKMVIYIDENNELTYSSEPVLELVDNTMKFSEELSWYSMDNRVLKEKLVKYLSSFIMADFDSFQTIDTIIVDHR